MVFMHMDKVKINGGDYTRLKGHMEREHTYYKNNVDIERSSNNITIVPFLTEEEMQNKAHMEASNKIRSDSVGSLNFVVTVPKDEELYDCTDYLSGTTSYEDWANDMIDATLQAMDLKRSDVLGAVLHMDETTPHLHFSVMPLKQIGEQYKLCAREIADKSHLNQLHDKVQAYMTDKGYTGRYVSEELSERGLGKESLQEFKKNKEILGKLYKQKDKCMQEIKSLNNRIKDLKHIEKEILSKLKPKDHNIVKQPFDKAIQQIIQRAKESNKTEKEISEKIKKYEDFER